MTTASLSSPEDRDDRSSDDPLRPGARVQLGLIGVLLRFAGGRRRGPTSEVIPGQLIVAAPTGSPLDSVIRVVARRFPRHVDQRYQSVEDPDEEAPEPTAHSGDDSFERLSSDDPAAVPSRMSYRYLRVGCAPGTERLIGRALRVVGGGLRFSPAVTVLTSQPVRLRAEGPDTPLGPIAFLDEFDSEVHDARSPGNPYHGAGVGVLVVDCGIPEAATWPGDPAVAGHPTLMYEIVRRVAPSAVVQAVDVGDQQEASSWSLLRAMTLNRDVDIMVVSLSLDTGKGRLAQERAAFMRTWLDDLTDSPRRPIVVMPTGNARDGESTSEIALPGRLPASITIGAVSPNGRRPSGSRYGRKDPPDTADWWLAPGGDWTINGVTASLITVDGKPQAGTSIANAIAGGLIACLLEERTSQMSIAGPGADVTDLIEQLVAAVPEADRPRWRSRLRDLELASRGAITRRHVLEDLRARARRLPEHDELEHGRGRLTL